MGSHENPAAETSSDRPFHGMFKHLQKCDEPPSKVVSGLGEQPQDLAFKAGMYNRMGGVSATNISDQSDTNYGIRPDAAYQQKANNSFGNQFFFPGGTNPGRVGPHGHAQTNPGRVGPHGHAQQLEMLSQSFSQNTSGGTREPWSSQPGPSGLHSQIRPRSLSPAMLSHMMGSQKPNPMMQHMGHVRPGNFSDCMPMPIGVENWTDPLFKKPKKRRAKKRDKKANNICDRSSPCPNVDIRQLMQAQGQSAFAHSSTFQESHPAFLRQQPSSARGLMPGIAPVVPSLNPSPVRMSTCDNAINPILTDRSRGGNPLLNSVSSISPTSCTDGHCDSGSNCSSTIGSVSAKGTGNDKCENDKQCEDKMKVSGVLNMSMKCDGRKEDWTVKSAHQSTTPSTSPVPTPTSVYQMVSSTSNGMPDLNKLSPGSLLSQMKKYSDMVNSLNYSGTLKNHMLQKEVKPGHCNDKGQTCNEPPPKTSHNVSRGEEPHNQLLANDQIKQSANIGNLHGNKKSSPQAKNCTKNPDDCPSNQNLDKINVCQYSDNVHGTQTADNGQKHVETRTPQSCVTIAKKDNASNCEGTSKKSTSNKVLRKQLGGRSLKQGGSHCLKSASEKIQPQVPTSSAQPHIGNVAPAGSRAHVGSATPVGSFPASSLLSAAARGQLTNHTRPSASNTIPLQQPHQFSLAPAIIPAGDHNLGSDQTVSSCLPVGLPLTTSVGTAEGIHIVSQHAPNQEITQLMLPADIQTNSVTTLPITATSVHNMPTFMNNFQSVSVPPMLMTDGNGTGLAKDQNPIQMVQNMVSGLQAVQAALVSVACTSPDQSQSSKSPCDRDGRCGSAELGSENGSVCGEEAPVDENMMVEADACQPILQQPLLVQTSQHLDPSLIQAQNLTINAPMPPISVATVTAVTNAITQMIPAMGIPQQQLLTQQPIMQVFNQLGMNSPLMVANQMGMLNSADGSTLIQPLHPLQMSPQLHSGQMVMMSPDAGAAFMPQLQSPGQHAIPTPAMIQQAVMGVHENMGSLDPADADLSAAQETSGIESQSKAEDASNTDGQMPTTNQTDEASGSNGNKQRGGRKTPKRDRSKKSGPPTIASMLQAAQAQAVHEFPSAGISLAQPCTADLSGTTSLPGQVTLMQSNPLIGMNFQPNPVTIVTDQHISPQQLMQAQHSAGMAGPTLAMTANGGALMPAPAAGQMNCAQTVSLLTGLSGMDACNIQGLQLAIPELLKQNVLAQPQLQSQQQPQTAAQLLQLLNQNLQGGAGAATGGVALEALPLLHSLQTGMMPQTLAAANPLLQLLQPQNMTPASIQPIMQPMTQVSMAIPTTVPDNLIVNKKMAEEVATQTEPPPPESEMSGEMEDMPDDQFDNMEDDSEMLGEMDEPGVSGVELEQYADVGTAEPDSTTGTKDFPVASDKDDMSEACDAKQDLSSCDSQESGQLHERDSGNETEETQSSVGADTSSSSTTPSSAIATSSMTGGQAHPDSPPDSGIPNPRNLTEAVSAVVRGQQLHIFGEYLDAADSVQSLWQSAGRGRGGRGKGAKGKRGRPKGFPQRHDRMAAQSKKSDNYLMNSAVDSSSRPVEVTSQSGTILTQTYESHSEHYPPHTNVSTSSETTCDDRQPYMSPSCSPDSINKLSPIESPMSTLPLTLVTSQAMPTLTKMLEKDKPLQTITNGPLTEWKMPSDRRNTIVNHVNRESKMKDKSLMHRGLKRTLAQLMETYAEGECFLREQNIKGTFLCTYWSAIYSLFIRFIYVNCTAADLVSFIWCFNF